MMHDRAPLDFSHEDSVLSRGLALQFNFAADLLQLLQQLYDLWIADAHIGRFSRMSGSCAPTSFRFRLAHLF